ncbi:uncharacterized protein [Salminus brasiliensis]|uniref:uncharacterized protein n=1 Tax=Salminus brasiliensis TaxID=930266 RepID=UPI003B82D158
MEECGKNISSKMSLQEDQDEIESSSGTADRPNSPGSSCVSFKSDQSIGEPLNLKEGPAPSESGTAERPNSPGSSCVSFKSDQSIGEPLNLKEGPAPSESDTGQTADSSVSSQELLKKNKRQKPALQKSLSKDCPSQQRGHMGSELDAEADKPQRNPKDFFDIFNDLENKMIAFIKHELEMYKKLLRKQNTTYYRNVKQMKWNLKQTVFNMTLTFLNLMNHKDVATALQNELIGIIQRPLKEGLISKFDRVSEGIAKQGESTRLNEIYTDLYITEGGAGQVNKEHEVRLIEKNQMQQDVQIKCKNMFKAGQDRPIRSVLTQGVAGIGKSICVQKFILDWAAGEDHQDIQFIFPLPFRELNLKKGCHSLMDIIVFFFPETKGLILTDQNSVMFVFDGLDECKLPLMFQKNESLNDVCKPAPLDVVLTNLIKGNLLPSALIWITTRPAAASRIPAEHVHRMTELRGFNNQQKEEYFRKRISDENLATKIIEHIKESRSLFIMCHIPVFCWISATVLQRILQETESGETPKTLTEMYTCFLIFQAVQGNLKYSGKNVLDVPWDKEAIHSLGKLALKHLKKNSLIFYTEDLEACGVDPSKISVYSGLCTQETVRFLGTVFSFVHLSIQEFLAAVFAYLSLRNDHKNVFDQQSTSVESKTTELTEFLKTAVDKALKSDHGHLDLFLRFLLGLSLESNEKLIRGLLTQSGSRSDHRKEIVEYIKLKFKDNPSPERSINLFYCLNELNDDSLVKDIQSYMSSGSLSKAELSPAQWSALVFVLLTSKEKLEVFDLQKFIRSEECLNRLLPVVQEATTALLSECNLTERSCSALLKVLSSVSSTLILLDLSNNPIQDFGVELLSEGLKSPTCKLETLRLNQCELTKESCSALADVLNSKCSCLQELNLNNNNLLDSGVICISDGLKNSQSTLKIMRLSNCSVTKEGCAVLTSALKSNPSLHLTELDLSGNKLEDEGVTLLCDLLMISSCTLEKLNFCDNNITQEGYAALASALKSNTSSHLAELDLGGNDPGDTGVKKLTDLQKNKNCKLKTLKFLKSSAAEEACNSLTEALGTNPLLLTELDLSGRIQGDSEMEKLSDLLKDSHCRTQKLKLNSCNITEKSCAALSSALHSNPSHLRELDLSGNKLQNSGVQQICGLLEDAQFKLSNIQLCNCNITEKGSASLASALKSNSSSNLRELGLSENNIGDSGVKKLIELLQNSNCILEKLNLSFCCISEEGYTALAPALKSNLVELDLSGNDPGDTGVALFTGLLEDPQCSLKTLRLLTANAEEFCDHLTEALGTNPLLLTELDLSGRIQGDSEMNQLSGLLKDSHCRPEKIKLNNSSITEEGCAALSAALSSNPSHLKELDLSENKLGNPGVKQICDLLKILDCRLAKLNLSDCSVTQEGYEDLASALKSNPSSHLTELDLRGNDPGDSGVKKLTDLVEDSNCKLKTLRLLKTAAAEEAWTSLSSALRINILLQTELKLSRNPAGPSGDSTVKLLCAVLQDTHCKLRRLQINDDDLTEESCSALATVLTSSTLTELDLSSNNLQDSGVKELCSGLKDPLCKLQTLRLSFCNIREEGYTALGSALSSALRSTVSSPFVELDLRGNDPGDTGVELLVNLSVKKLRLLKSNAAEEAYTYFKQKLGKDPLLQTELDLSQTEPKKIRVDQLSALLEDPHCRLQKLTMYKSSSITVRDCADLISALTVNSSHLRELDLNENKLDQAGLQKLCDLLKNPHCRLEKLSLRGCCLSGEGYEALASALKSNPSSVMTELDLRGNDPGETGVRLFTDLQNDPRSKLKTLRLLKSSAAEEVCDYLTEALGINPLLLTELDLSGRIQGDSEMKKLCDLLEDSHCRTQILKLNNNSITEEGCDTLSKALCSNYSHLKELDLSGNKLGNSGVKHVASLLRISDGKVEKLNISDCGLTEGGYAALASALKSNPSSSLKELDLRGNDPGDTGVKQLWDLKEDSKCNLNTLRVLKSSAAEKLCDHLTEALGINPLLQTELDLSGKIQGDSEMKKLSDLLKDSHCRTQKLKLNNSSITEEGCAVLSAALSSNPSHLKELDLSENKLGNPGVKQICDLLTNQCCKLQRLRLSFCSVMGVGYAALASALKSNGSSPLMELDLRGNDPGDAGVELIRYFDYLSKGSKKTLRLLKKDAADQAYTRLKQILQKNPLVQTELDLSKTDPKQIQVQQLSALLEDPHCRLQKLTMYKSSSITERDCADLISALTVNPSHLRELDLSENKLDQAGLQKLCDLLKNPHCRLKKLSLRCCCISEEGYAALASALNLNTSSPLMELDLRGNDPGDKGVKLIMDLEKDSQTKGRRIRLLKSSAAEKLCDHLTEALGTNPLLLRELDLSGRIQGDSEMKQLSGLLKDSHCRPEKIKLNNSRITEEGCASLSAALSSNPSHLKELDLSENKLGNPGVKKICNLLKILDCRLAKLNLSDCSVTQEGYEDLASALKSNPSSHLTELDLRGNDPGDSGVKKLTDLVEDSNCKLKTLRLLKTAAAEEAWTSLSSALGINILLLTELKLSRNPAGPSGDSRVKLLCAVLQDTHCKLRRLWINDDDLTEESCSALATVLTSSTLTELDLSSNNLQDSGVKELCSGLKDPLCKLKKLSLSFCRITEGGYAALASALKSPSSALTELDLRGNDPGDTGVKQLTGLFMNTKKKLRLLKSDAAKEAYTYFKRKLGKDPLLQTELDLSQTGPKEITVDQLSALLEDPHCRLQKLTMYKSSSITERDCADLISALTVNPSHLRELDLKENKLDQAGLQKLCDLLKNPHCRLEKLSLRCCCISEEGYAALASALNLNTSSPLMELDLRGNDPGDKGVKLIMDLEKDSQTKGRRIRLLKSSAAEKLCDHLTGALGTNPLLLRELDLRGRIQGDSEMKQLSDLLEDSHCRPEKIKLNNSRITEEGCAALSAALSSNPSHLKELDLSENKLGNSGVKKICNLLKILDCRLAKLNLSDCSVKQEGYEDLASALKSNPSSHLTELDLRGNDPGDSGVKKLTDLVEDSNCKLKTLRLLKTAAAEEAWTSLSSALGINILLQTELKLSRNPAGPSGDSRVKLLCAVLQDTHCKLRRLRINDDDLTEESCSALATVLTSSTLTELDLSSNNLQDSGVKELCSGLKDPLCKLKKLSLSFCRITEGGYAALASALKSSSSALTELDLRGNDPGDTGVKQLTGLFVNTKKKLRLLKSDAAEEAYTYFKQKLGKDPLLQTELDLSQTEPKKIRVDQLSALLEDPHCRLQKLTMYKSSSITERDCADLISALTVNPSHLRELDLSENKLDQAGLQKLCDLLKNPHCRLEKLRLVQSLTEGGCAGLASALFTNPSHIRELDLSLNKLGASGVQQLCRLVENQKCELQKLQLKKCSIEEDGCAALTSALSSNPSHLRELDLRENKLGKSVEQLSELMKKSGCSLRLDQSTQSWLPSLPSLTSWFSRNTDKPQHSANQEKPEEDDEVGEGDGAGQCNRTSEQTAGERDGAGQCNWTSEQTAGERNRAGQCNRTSVQTAGERDGAGQCNWTSEQTAGERNRAGQCNRTSEQTAGERNGAGQCNRTSE